MWTGAALLPLDPHVVLLGVAPDLGAGPRPNMLLDRAPISLVKTNTFKEKPVLFVCPPALQTIGLLASGGHSCRGLGWRSDRGGRLRELSSRASEEASLCDLARVEPRQVRLHGRARLYEVGCGNTSSSDLISLAIIVPLADIVLDRQLDLLGAQVHISAFRRQFGRASLSDTIPTRRRWQLDGLRAKFLNRFCSSGGHDLIDNGGRLTEVASPRGGPRLVQAHLVDLELGRLVAHKATLFALQHVGVVGERDNSSAWFGGARVDIGQSDRRQYDLVFILLVRHQHGRR